MFQKLKAPSVLMYLFLFVVVIFTYLYSHIGVAVNYDVFGYYSYLPVTFIYHDIPIGKPETYNLLVYNFNLIHSTSATNIYTVFPVDGGNYAIKYTSGWAICYLPFFFLGHLIAILSGYVPDGFSAPYHNAILFGTIFYTLLGIYYLRKLLKLFYSEITTAIILFITVFGTNYFIHTAFHTAGAMTHNHLFTLVTMLIYYTHLWYKKPNVKYSLFIGLLFGLIALTRATELTIVFLFLFWSKVALDKSQSVLGFVKTNIKYILLIALITLAICSLQLIYWKIVSGKFIYNSYNFDASEGFDFGNPHIIELLFSFRKGWFLYTPLTMFIFYALYKMFKNKYKMFWPLFVYSIVNIYVVASWSNWWYADSYSCRALIPYLPVFALSLAYLYESVYLMQFKRSQKIVFLSLFSFLFIYSEFKIWQGARTVIHYRLMTKDYFFKSFFLLKRDMDLEEKHLSFDRFRYNGQPIPNITELIHKKIVPIMDFEDIPNDISFEGKGALKVDDKMEFSPSIRMKISDLTGKYYLWVRVKVYVYLIDSLNIDNTPMLTSYSDHNGAAYNYQGKRFSDLNLQPNKWNLVEYDYLSIEQRSKDDDLGFYIWNPGKLNFYVDNFSIETFEPRKND